MLFIYVSRTPQSRPSIWLKVLAADYDAEGHLAGIEILNVVERLGNKETFKKVVLEDIALLHH